MQKLFSKDIKNVELNILLELNAFCKKNGLRYYLSGGTLLGAIRHHGFIPWDDDIDVCMPRKDYEYLINNFSSAKSYLQIWSSENKKLDAPCAKLVDMRTTVSNPYVKSNAYEKLWIDIMPIDGLPNDFNEVDKIYKECDRYRWILIRCDMVLGLGSTTLKKCLKYVFKPLLNLYGKGRCIRNIEKIALKNPYETSEYVGAVTWGLYGTAERMLKSEFEKPVEVEFEGYKFPTFSCWDSYLHGLYGDYMKLPPVEQRKTHDITVFIDN